MLRIRSFYARLLLTVVLVGGVSAPGPAGARDRPGTPNQEALFVCGYKFLYTPTLCGIFHNTATEVVKIEMEMTRNGTPFAYNPERLDCRNITNRVHQNTAVLNRGGAPAAVPGVHFTTDEICFELSRTYGRKKDDPDYGYIFELENADFSAQYCARFRARRASDQVVSEKWSNYACVQTPPKPPKPAKPSFSVSFSGSQAYGVPQSGDATVGEIAKVIPTTVTVTSNVSANVAEYRLADADASTVSFDGTIEPSPFDSWRSYEYTDASRRSTLHIRPEQGVIALSLCAYNASGKACEVEKISVLDQSPERNQMNTTRIPLPTSKPVESRIPSRTDVPAATVRVRNPASMPGVDLPGGDYSSKPIAGTAEDCAEACTLDGKCVAWTWVKPGVQNAQAMCWLKNSVPARTPNVNATSGIKGGSVVR